MISECVETKILNRKTMKELTAEEFFRNKIKEMEPNNEVTMSQRLITAEQGLRWAHEFKEIHLQSKGKPDKSKLNDRDREMEGNLSVLIGSEIAIINKGIKQEIDWQMISDWLVKKIGPKQESKGKTREELRAAFKEKFGMVLPIDNAHDVLDAVEKWLMEEYAQSHANQDGWVRVPVGSWIEFDAKTNAELFSIEARKNCLCKFDDGEVCRFNDDHPKAILTHFQITA